jgi:hypothetical protein
MAHGVESSLQSMDGRWIPSVVNTLRKLKMYATLAWHTATIWMTGSALARWAVSVMALGHAEMRLPIPRLDKERARPPPTT